MGVAKEVAGAGAGAMAMALALAMALAMENEMTRYRYESRTFDSMSMAIMFAAFEYGDFNPEIKMEKIEKRA